MVKGKYIWIAGIFVLAVVTFFIFSSSGGQAYPFVEGFDGDITIYKSSSCGCCNIYTSYFEKRGRDVKVIMIEDMDQIKQQNGVPSELESCHTTIVGDYFVEGHVPLEAIEKLIIEQPDLAGIALAGMPNGSPGMPGTKKGDFVIQGVNKDGTYQEFMRI